MIEREVEEERVRETKVNMKDLPSRKVSLARRKFTEKTAKSEISVRETFFGRQVIWHGEVTQLRPMDDEKEEANDSTWSKCKLCVLAKWAWLQTVLS